MRLPAWSKRSFYLVWMALIFGFALLHALHLSADFPNHSLWSTDWAKYTDEGWYGNAAIRAHLFGNWYMPGDFNPAPAIPAWPFLEWVLFFFTGVSLEAARGLAVGFFFVNLMLSYLLLRARGPRWMALVALTLIVTSPFLYCFSRLAILEPMLTACTLATLNLAVRVARVRRPIWAAGAVGLLFSLMMLTKTSAIFILPAVVWAMVLPLREDRKRVLRAVLAAGLVSALTYGSWLIAVIRMGLLPDYKYLFFVNKYNKPPRIDWPLESFWWSFHGGLWVDHILIPLAGLILVGMVLAWRGNFGRQLRTDPVFGASVLGVLGCLLFMTVQNHPQPRYFAVVAFFGFFLVAQGTAVLLNQKGLLRQLGASALAVAAVAAFVNASWTLGYAMHPQYTFVSATQQLTRYIDQHPNGKRLLVSISGDEITMATHLPSLCDDFGTQELSTKLAAYQPGWYAAWNDLDPGTLADIHTHFSLEQVASFHAFDDPDRNVLVLFKLHPLAKGLARDEVEQNLQVPQAEDKIDIPIE